MGCVDVAVTFTPAARLLRAVSKSWLLHAWTWARATATAGTVNSSLQSGSWSPVPALCQSWSASHDGRPARCGGQGWGEVCAQRGCDECVQVPVDDGAAAAPPA